MGSNHPISLKLQRSLNWNSSIYKYNLQKLLEHQQSLLLISKIIQHYFQSLIISKPIYQHFGNGELSIIIYCYIKPKIKNNQNKRGKHKLYLGQPQSKIVKNYNKIEIKKLILPWQINRLKKLENILTLTYGKKVRIELIKLKNPILNGSVLAQYLSANSTRHGIHACWRKLLQSLRLANLKFFNTPISFNWHNFVVNGYSFLFNQFNSYIIGIKLKISGRMSRRRGASRTKVKNYSIGSFSFNSALSLIDYGFIEKKGKNGSQSIKVFISSKIFYHS